MQIPIQIIRIHSQDITMEFGIEKYCIHVIKCRKRETMEGRELQNKESIRSLGEKENY